MDPPTSEAQWSILDDRINILNKSMAEVSPAQQVYSTSSDILALVRVSVLVLPPPTESHWWPNQHKLIDNKDSVQLSEYCFNVCETVKTAIRGKGTGDISKSARIALKELERCVDSFQPCQLTTTSNFRFTSEIERTLRRWADAPHTEYNDKEVRSHKLEIQRILGVLTAPEFPPGGGPGVGEHPPNSAPVDPHKTASPPTPSEDGMSLAPPLPILYGILIVPKFNLLSQFNPPAVGLLIKGEFSQRELPLLVEAIFSSKDERDIIRCLRGDDAQAFINIIDEACSPPRHGETLPTEIDNDTFC